MERNDPAVEWSGPIYPPIPLAETEWDVFGRDGVWLGPVTMPARFRLMAVRGDRVAGLERSELDVEYVTVYAIRREVR